MRAGVGAMAVHINVPHVVKSDNKFACTLAQHGAASQRMHGRAQRAHTCMACACITAT